MSMSDCGTFHYAGVVPDRADLERGRWTLADESGAAARTAGEFAPERDNRLVGLRPMARVSGRWLVLRATGPERAEVREAWLKLDRSLLQHLQGGDRIELARTRTSDIGLSVLRGGDVLWAVGALTTVSLGSSLRARGGSAPMDRESRRRTVTWVDVSTEAETMRLHDGARVTLGPYSVTVARTFKYGAPGEYENMAVSRGAGGIDHETVVRAAAILAEWGAGLTMVCWQALAGDGADRERTCGSGD
jgi:hypothetical protein